MTIWPRLISTRPGQPFFFGIGIGSTWLGRARVLVVHHAVAIAVWERATRLGWVGVTACRDLHALILRIKDAIAIGVLVRTAELGRIGMVAFGLTGALILAVDDAVFVGVFVGAARLGRVGLAALGYVWALILRIQHAIVIAIRDRTARSSWIRLVPAGNGGQTSRSSGVPSRSRSGGGQPLVRGSFLAGPASRGQASLRSSMPSLSLSTRGGSGLAIGA
jgi:hypothetical protein